MAKRRKRLTPEEEQEMLQKFLEKAAETNPTLAAALEAAKNIRVETYPELDGMAVSYGPWLVVTYPKGPELSMSERHIGVKLPDIPGGYMMPEAEYVKHVTPIVGTNDDPHSWPPEMIHKVAQACVESYRGFWGGFMTHLAEQVEVAQPEPKKAKPAKRRKPKC